MVAELGRAQERQRGEGRNRKGDDHLRARCFQGGDLRPDVRIGRDIVLPARVRDGRRAELSIETFDAVGAKLVVLVEIRDLLAAKTLLTALAEDLALDGVVRLHAE